MNQNPYSERMWFMPAEPVPADPGPGDDLAWLDRDPMTAQEREAWLDRVCEQDGPPEPDEYEDFDPLTPDAAHPRTRPGPDHHPGLPRHRPLRPRLKQHPRWHVDQLPDGTYRWTTPAGRTYTTEPTRYPI